MKRTGVGLGVALGLAVSVGACDGRTNALERQVAGKQGPAHEPLPEPEPSHELRDQLAPVLREIYPLSRVPRVVVADRRPEDGAPYALEAGVAAVVKLAPGLSRDEQIQAVLRGVAEADAWAYREHARRDYADLVRKVLRGYGRAQRDQVVKIYAELRLLQFFNSERANTAIDALAADLQDPVNRMQAHYTTNKEEVWQDWMAVKMYARRVVADEEPFRSVLGQIQKELGKEEPAPRTWEQSMDPAFSKWAQQVKDDEELLVQITNMKEPRARQEFLTDTHALWLMPGSDRIPRNGSAPAKIPIDKEMGFGVLRQNLGGGHDELTFVFSRSLFGPRLKKAFIRSLIYAHLLHDFSMLATAGTDWAQRDSNGAIDPNSAVVPDAYEALYAKCGSAAAIDSLIKHSGKAHAVLAGLSQTKRRAGILETAHACVVSGAGGKVYVPAEDDETDVEGPAPGSRLALFQMLARFERAPVDAAAAAGDQPTEEDATIAEQEALLKALSRP